MVSESRLRTLSKIEDLKDGTPVKIKFRTGEYVPAFYRGRSADSEGPIFCYSEDSAQGATQQAHFYSMLWVSTENQNKGLMFRAFHKNK